MPISILVSLNGKKVSDATLNVNPTFVFESDEIAGFHDKKKIFRTFSYGKQSLRSSVSTEDPFFIRF